MDSAGLQRVAKARDSKRSDILTYFAMLHLRGIRPPPFRLLPPETRADIKLLWTSYQNASEASRHFLFDLGKPELIREACVSAPAGKLLPSDFYIHRSLETELPTLLRVLFFVARQVVAEVEYNIVKVSLDGRKVSFLNYPQFDEEAHPELLHSVRVHLPTASYGIKDYSESENPPILHRKENFVDLLYPLFTHFASLTEQEEAAGLLGRPDIGFKRQWNEILSERKLQVVGHSLSQLG